MSEHQKHYKNSLIRDIYTCNKNSGYIKLKFQYIISSELLIFVAVNHNNYDIVDTIDITVILLLFLNKISQEKLKNGEFPSGTQRTRKADLSSAMVLWN